MQVQQWANPGNLTVEVTTEPRTESYGLISGAITIAARKQNVHCAFPPDRVKAVVVGKFGNNFKAIPDGFPEKGNYIYKDRNGINQLELYKLDWNKDYHVGFEWLPDIDDEGYASGVFLGGYGAGLPGGGAL